MRRRLFGIVVFAVVLTAFGGLAFAQEEPEQEKPGVPEETVEMPVSVGEITVTAQKREQDIQDVPVSVSALLSAELEVLTAGGADIRMLSGRVPSLLMESSFGRAFPRFYIRGIGNPDFDLNSSQPVSMVVDEVVLENPVVKGMPIFDLQRIEVLRGPQGTLFGRNTPAGIVKFESVKPSQEFDAYAQLSYGTFGTVDLQAAVGGSLGGNWSGRFSALYQSRSDWIDNEWEAGPEDKLGGYTTTGYRGQLLWEPNDRFSGLLNLHGWDVDGTARIFRANIFNQGEGGLVSGFQQDEVWHDGRNEQDINSFGGVLRLEYDLGAATLVSVTGYETLDMYSRGDIDGGYGAVFAPPSGPGVLLFAAESADGLDYLDQWTQEFRLVSNGGGPWNWIVGAYYFNEQLKVDSYSYDSLADGADDGFSFQEQDATAYALFGSVDWQLSDSWMLKAGLRWSHDEKDFVAQRLQPLFINTLLFGTQPSVPIYRDVSDDNVSWDLSALFAVNDNVNLYGRVATGFRAPSIQGRILFCQDIDGTDPATNCVSVADTETILSAEVGVKTILAENKLRFNLTGYIWEMSDQQITAVGGDININNLLNAEKTEGYGLETDIQWTPSANWLITLGASYNPTEIKDEDLTVQTCDGGCTVLDPTAPDPGDPFGQIAFINGNSLPHAPDTIFNGIINYQSDVANKGFFGALDWVYYSEKSFFLYDSVEFKDDGFEVGLRLGYGWNQGRYEIALFSRNLLDADIARGGIDFNNLTGFVNDPRIVGIEFIGRF